MTGSEGTLAFTTEIKLNLIPTPPPHDVVIAIHFDDIIETMKAVVVVMKHHPDACELMDKFILDCTKDNLEQQKNRFFVEGDPAAILLVELRNDTIDEALKRANAIIEDLKSSNFGYAFPIIKAPKTKQVWALRKAGLGLLANMPGDAKAVACIEDTAVEVNDLPSYISDFEHFYEKR